MFKKLIKVLEGILQELKDVHFHLDRLETMYMFTNKVHIETKEEIEKEKKIKK